MENMFFWQYSFAPGFEFDCVRYTATQSAGALHWHNYCQLALCVGGQGTFTFSGKSYAYAPGDLFVVDNTERHGAFVAPGETADFLFVMFYPQFVVRGTESAFDYEYLLPVSYASEEFSNKIDGDTPFGRRLAAMLLDIEAENNRRRTGFSHIIGAKLRLILAELLGYYGIRDDARSIVDRHRKLRPAILYLEQHCHEPVRLEDIAKIVYLSPSRFRHLFQETMHVGFKEYVIGLRYQMALRMLASTSSSVEEIAASCGFSNLNSFYKLFRQREGTTPTAYRNALTQKE